MQDGVQQVRLRLLERAARGLQAPRDVSPRAARRRAGLVLAAVLGAGLLGGVVWLGGNGRTGGADSGAGAAKRAPNLAEDRRQGPGERDAGAGTSRTPEGYVACARLVVEGTVLSVEPLAEGTRERITLQVSRHYKPTTGKAEVTFVLDVSVDPRARSGDHVLIGIPQGEAAPDLWSTGSRLAEDRAWIEKALPKARGTRC